MAGTPRRRTEPSEGLPSLSHEPRRSKHALKPAADLGIVTFLHLDQDCGNYIYIYTYVYVELFYRVRALFFEQSRLSMSLRTSNGPILLVSLIWIASQRPANEKHPMEFQSCCLKQRSAWVVAMA